LVENGVCLVCEFPQGFMVVAFSHFPKAFFGGKRCVRSIFPFSLGFWTLVEKRRKRKNRNRCRKREKRRKRERVDRVENDNYILSKAQGVGR